MLQFLAELPREELNNLALQALLLFPVGAVEQHGPHLPVGTDTLIVEQIAYAAAMLAASAIPIVLAPVMPFGSSQHHLPFGGTMSLSTESYYRVLYELGESLIISGFRRIFILNSHGGNNELIQLVVRDLALRYPICAAAASYWVTAWDALISLEAHLHGRLPGHAGAFETSLIAALHPELVRPPMPHRDTFERSPSRSFYGSFRREVHGIWQAIDGYSDSPDRASAEHGQHYMSAINQAVASSLVEFYQFTLEVPQA